MRILSVERLGHKKERMMRKTSKCIVNNKEAWPLGERARDLCMGGSGLRKVYQVLSTRCDFGYEATASKERRVSVCRTVKNRFVKGGARVGMLGGKRAYTSKKMLGNGRYA